MFAELLSDHMLCAYWQIYFCVVKGYQWTPKTHKNLGKARDLLHDVALLEVMHAIFTQNGYIQSYVQ